MVECTRRLATASSLRVSIRLNQTNIHSAGSQNIRPMRVDGRIGSCEVIPHLARLPCKIWVPCDEFFAPYTFSCLSSLIKTRSSAENTMFIVYANCLQVTSDCSKQRCIGNRDILSHTRIGVSKTSGMLVPCPP